MKKFYIVAGVAVLTSTGCAPMVAAQELILGKPELYYDYPLQVSDSGDKLLAVNGSCFTIFNLENNKVIYKNCQDRHMFFDSSLSKTYIEGKISEINGQSLGVYDPNLVVVEDILLQEKAILPLENGKFETVYPRKITNWGGKKFVFATNSEGIYAYEYDGEFKKIAQYSGIFLDAIENLVLIRDSSNQVVVYDTSGKPEDSFQPLKNDSIFLGGYAKFVNKNEILYFGNIGESDLSIKLLNLKEGKIRNTKLADDLRASLYDSRLRIGDWLRMPNFDQMALSSSLRKLFVKNGQTIIF